MKIYEDGENYDNADLKTPAKKLTLASEDCGKTPGMIVISGLAGKVQGRLNHMFFFPVLTTNKNP